MPVKDARPSAPSMMSIGLRMPPACSSWGSIRATRPGEKGGTSSPLAVRRSAATEPWPPPSAITATRRPRARGERTNARQASTSSPGRVDAHDARLAAGGGDHGVVRDERARVRGGAARARGRAPAVEQDHGLLPRGRARGLDERAAVGDVLGVDRDRARGLVAGEVLHQVGQAHVGLVADRGEAREAEPAALEQHAELDREVARLRDQANRPVRVVVGRDVELRERVVDADAVGPEHDGARLAHVCDERALPDAAGIAPLGEPRRDHDQRARTLGERLLDGLLEARLGHRDDDGLDRLAHLGEAREQRMPVDLAPATVDQVHGAAVRAAQRGASQPVAPLARIGRRAEYGDRGRGEERLEVARFRHSSPFAIAREMIRRWISELPSQISWSLASRNHFSTGYSRE